MSSPSFQFEHEHESCAVDLEFGFELLYHVDSGIFIYYQTLRRYTPSGYYTPDGYSNKDAIYKWDPLILWLSWNIWATL